MRQIKQLIYLSIGKTNIVTTPEHPFFIKNKWVKAKELNKGDSVLLFNQKKVVINSKFVKDTTCTVYNFAVENYHTYFVSNLSVLVHNDNPCAQPVKKTKSHQTYEKQPLDPKKDGVYSGKTSGTGTPEQNPTLV